MAAAAPTPISPADLSALLGRMGNADAKERNNALNDLSGQDTPQPHR